MSGVAIRTSNVCKQYCSYFSVPSFADDRRKRRESTPKADAPHTTIHLVLRKRRNEVSRKQLELGQNFSDPGILNVRSRLVICVEQHFVQASPIKTFTRIFDTLRSVPFLRAEAVRIRRLSSQPSLCLVERNGSLDVSGSIQNPNFTAPKAGAVLCIVDGLLLI